MARRGEIRRACECTERCLSHTHRSLQTPVVIGNHGLHLQWGKAFRILNVIDEYTRECLAVRVKQRLTHKDVLEMLTGLFIDQSVVITVEHNNKT